MPSAAVFSSDLVKEHLSYLAGGLAECQMDNSCRTWKLPVKDSAASYEVFDPCGVLAAIKSAVNSKCARQIRYMRDTYVEIYKKMG